MPTKIHVQILICPFSYAEPTFSEEPPIPDPVPLSRMEIKEMAAGERSKGLLGHIGLTPT